MGSHGRRFFKAASIRLHAIVFFTGSLLLVAQFVFILGALERPAYAYVDPGSGLLFFQIISTSLAGAAYLLRSRLRSWFSRKKVSAPEDGSTEPKSGDGIVL